MKKLVRELKQTVIIILVVAVLLLAIYVLSHMAGLLGWIWKNILPFGIGFVVALLAKAGMNALMAKEDDK